MPGGKPPFPAVVMLHGCAGAFDRAGELRARPAFWSDRFRRDGYVVLVVDSFGSRGHGSICGRANRPLSPFADRPFDAWAGLGYLLGRRDLVRPDRVALVGWSNGAMTALRTLERGNDQKPAGFAGGFRAAVAFYPGCIVLGRRGYATDTPTLLLIGLKDDWTKPKPCIRLVDRASGSGSPMSIVTYPDAHHGFDLPNSPVRARTTRNSSWKSGERTVHSGTDPAARADAIRRVGEFLGDRLKN